MSKTVLVSTSASLVAGIFIGAAGISLMSREEKTAAPAPVTAAASNNSYSATITHIATSDVIHIRAHTWVAQFAMASVCARGKVAEPKPCTYEADFNAAALKKGASITLQNLLPAAGVIAPHNITPDIPQIRPRQDVLEGPVQARVLKLLDGDTVQVVAEPFPGHTVITDIRIGEIDTPEKKGRAKCAAEATLAERASAETQALIGGKSVTLYKIQFEKYGGRMLGSIHAPDGTDAAQNLIDKGLAKPYDGGKKASWCGLS